MKQFIALTAFSLLAFCSASTEAALVFDDFQDNQNHFAPGPSPPVAVTSPDFNSSQRILERVGGGGGSGISIGGGLLNVFLNSFNPAAPTPGRFQISYDFPPAGPAGVLSPAINPSLSPSIKITGASWFSGGGPLALELGLSSGGPLEFVDATSTLAANTSSDIEFLLSDFGTINFDSINRIVIQTNGFNTGSPDLFAGNFQASSVIVTPEPSGFILAGFGIASLIAGSYIRRRRSSLAATVA